MDNSFRDPNEANVDADKEDTVIVTIADDDDDESGDNDVSSKITKTLVVSGTALLRNSGLCQHYLLAVTDFESTPQLPLPSKYYDVVDLWFTVIKSGNNPATGRYNLPIIKVLNGDGGDGGDGSNDHDGNITIATIDNLLSGFSLASYLDDNNYFSYLVRSMIYDWQELQPPVLSMSWQAKLTNDLERQMYLHFPHELLPDKLRTNTAFITSWVQNFSDKEEVIYNGGNSSMTVSKTPLIRYETLSDKEKAIFNKLLVGKQPKEYDSYPNVCKLFSRERTINGDEIKIASIKFLYFDFNFRLRYETATDFDDMIITKPRRRLPDYRWSIDGEFEIVNTT